MRSETVIQKQTMLKFANIGPVFRNNVGVAIDKAGRHIRYGLANSSAKENAVIKSSDLICITPVTAYLASTGQWHKLGVFTALEVKHEGWHMTPGDDRALAQAKFHDIVRQAGGFAGFVTDPAADIARITGYRLP